MISCCYWCPVAPRRICIQSLSNIPWSSIAVRRLKVSVWSPALDIPQTGPRSGYSTEDRTGVRSPWPPPQCSVSTPGWTWRGRTVRCCPRTWAWSSPRPAGRAWSPPRACRRWGRAAYRSSPAWPSSPPLRSSQPGRACTGPGPRSWSSACWAAAWWRPCWSSACPPWRWCRSSCWPDWPGLRTLLSGGGGGWGTSGGDWRETGTPVTRRQRRSWPGRDWSSASASSDLGDLEILPRQLSSDNWRQSREILRRLTPSNYSGGDNVGKIHTETAHCITPRLINSLSWVDDHQHRPLLPDDSLIPGHWTGGTFLLLYRPANSRWEWIDTNCLIGFFSQYVRHVTLLIGL